MKKIISICLIFLIFILSLNFVNAIAYSTNISCNDDAYVYNATADTNYGNAINLYVRNNATPEIYDTYLEYIVNDIPDDMEIDHAELCLYTDSINNSGKNVSIYLLNNSFVENIIKWKHNYRQYIQYNHNVSYEFNNSNVGAYTCVDITDLVNYSYSENEALLDLAIIGNETNDGTVIFSSKEGSNPSYLFINYSTDYSSWCQYNALKGGTISTCNSFIAGKYCNLIFDEKVTDSLLHPAENTEWETAGGFILPPNIAHTIINMDESFYFDRVEVWGRKVGVNTIQPKAYEVSVYSPEMDTWYLLFNETDAFEKDGWVNFMYFGGTYTGFSTTGMVPYIKDVDTIYIGNLSISKVQFKAYDTLVTLPYALLMQELAFCVMGEAVTITDEIDYSVAGVGVGCDTNDDCECDLCEYGFCALRTTNMNCVINGTSRDDCCLSGSCSGGKCTKAGLWESLDASKDQQFGDSTMTNNFISLFFVIAISGFLMYYGNVIAGVFALYMLSIFFAVVGWLSPFILIGMIITGLIALVFKIMIGSGTE